jgi:hypothetical protein
MSGPFLPRGHDVPPGQKLPEEVNFIWVWIARETCSANGSRCGASGERFGTGSRRVQVRTSMSAC